MTRALFDTNVVLDVLLNREPHAQASAQALALVERGEVQGFLCATTVTTVHSIAAKMLSANRARGLVHDLPSEWIDNVASKLTKVSDRASCHPASAK